MFLLYSGISSNQDGEGGGRLESKFLKIAFETFDWPKFHQWSSSSVVKSITTQKRGEKKNKNDLETE